VRRFLGEDISGLTVSQADRKVKEALYIRDIEKGILVDALASLLGT